MKKMNMFDIGMGVIFAMILVMAYQTIKTKIDAKKTGIPLEDERLAKVSGISYRAGFLIGACYLIVLNFYNIINIEIFKGEQLESMPVINSALIIMGVSVLIVRAYLSRKDDV